MKKFLKPGHLSQADKNIKKMASALKGKNKKEALHNIINFILRFHYHDLEGKNFKKWKTIFLQRSAGQILKSKVSYGCDDHALLFVTLARELGFPAKYITAKRLGKPGMHAWPRIYFKGQWLDINATTGELPYNYKKDPYGPYKILSQSLDPKDSVMKNYQDWIKIEKRLGNIIKV